MNFDIDPAQPEAGGPVVLDEAALSILRELDPSGTGVLMQRILSTYLGSLDKLNRQFDDATARHHLADFQLAAHTLKSSSTSMGALDLAQQCAAMELLCRQGQLRQALDLLPACKREIGRVALAVQALMVAPPHRASQG